MRVVKGKHCMFTPLTGSEVSMLPTWHVFPFMMATAGAAGLEAFISATRTFVGLILEQSCVWQLLSRCHMYTTMHQICKQRVLLSSRWMYRPLNRCVV